MGVNHHKNKRWITPLCVLLLRINREQGDMIMKNSTSYDILIGKYDGNFIASTIESPYFCLIGPTEEEVKKKVTKALAFYHDQQDHIVVSASNVKRRTISNFTPTSRVPSADFVAA